MRIKFILISALTLIVASAFAGCGNSQPQITESTPAYEIAATEGLQITENISETETTVAEGTDSVTETENVNPEDVVTHPISESEETKPEEGTTEVVYYEPQINFSDLE